MLKFEIKLLCLLQMYEQSDWSKKVITWGYSHVTYNRASSDLSCHDMSVNSQGKQLSCHHMSVNSKGKQLSCHDMSVNSQGKQLSCHDMSVNSQGKQVREVNLNIL